VASRHPGLHPLLLLLLRLLLLQAAPRAFALLQLLLATMLDALSPAAAVGGVGTRGWCLPGLQLAPPVSPRHSAGVRLVPLLPLPVG
jgi:hypothetical protein